MPSSISNSNERIPLCNHKKLWVYAVILWVLLSLVVECTYRVKGYSPTINSTELLWAYWRGKVYSGNGRKKVVILGKSRAQLGIVPKVIEDELPGYEAVHLAAPGTGCIATLRDLANDEKFDGVVICSVEPTILMETKLDEQQRYVDYFRNKRLSLNATANLLLTSKMQAMLCVMSPYNSVKYVVQNRLLARTRYRKHVKTQFNRYRAGYFYTKLNKREFAEMQERHRTPPPSSDYFPVDKFIAAIEEHLVPLCDKMAAKNAVVIFVRMPQSGEHWKQCARIYPRELYWDEIARRCGAPAIHFTDHPELSKFECPEGSHLDYEDALEFTKNLGSVIKKELKKDTGSRWALEKGEAASSQ